MEKVYVLTVEYQYDSGENGMEFMVFKKYENAVERFDQEVKKAKLDFENVTSDSEIEITNVGENKHWTIFENGAYSYNHINIKLVARYFEDVE